MEKVQKFFLSGLTQDIIVPFVLIIILVLLANPLGIAMPPALLGIIVLALVATFAASALFYWQEVTNDHKNRAKANSFSDKIAFFAGTTVIIAGVVIQSLLNVLDIWLAVALAALVGGKVWGKIYTELRE